MGSPTVDVPCQVCGGREREIVYARDFESIALGRVHVRLALCDCGFLYSTPRPTPELLDRHYESSQSASGAVWRAVGEGTRSSRFLGYRVGFVRRLLDEGREAGRVLDIGASNGDFLRALDLPGWEHVGLEPSRLAAAKARARGLEIHEARLEENSLPAESFDVVTCFSVLEHVWDVRRAMDAIEELVRPEGLLALYVPDSTKPVSAVSEFYAFEHLSHFSRGSLTALAKQYGFRPLFIERALESGIMAGFRKVGRDAATQVEVRPDRDELREAVSRYRRGRQGFERDLQERFEGLMNRWRQAETRVAVYGAGEHTLFLLDLVDFEDRIVGILDSDPAKHGQTFRRWQVHSPAEAAAIGADAVVVSSKPFQEEMVAALEPVVREHGIEVVRCY